MSIQKLVVSRDDSVYEAFPDVVLTSEGTLICVFTECNAHADRDNSRILITESTDRGRTWSQKHPLTEYSSNTDFYNCARISGIGEKTLVVICDKARKINNSETAGQLFLWYSYDNGRTWSEPVNTSDLGIKDPGIVPDKYRVLKNGRHIISAHKKGESGKLEQYLWYSDDNGRTWSDRVTVASDPRYNLCEGCILETDDGALVCYLRENSFIGTDCLKTISYDNGESWSEVYNVPVPGCHRPVVGKLNSGNLLMTYRFMPGGKGWLGSWTQNVFAALLKSDQATAVKRNEQSARILPLDYDRSPVSDLGYTGWMQFDDGEIFVVNYIVDDAPKAQIRGYSLFEGDFTL